MRPRGWWSSRATHLPPPPSSAPKAATSDQRFPQAIPCRAMAVRSASRAPPLQAPPHSSMRAAEDTRPSFSFVGGTGGRTIFTGNSSADHGTLHNHGATTISGAGIPLGGATHFYNSSTAGTANITNHADATYIYSGMEAKTVFYDSSDAGNATIENEGAASGTRLPGQTEFRGNSSAALSNIHNRGYITVGGLAGRTLFYDVLRPPMPRSTPTRATATTDASNSNQSTADRARSLWRMCLRPPTAGTSTSTTTPRPPSPKSFSARAPLWSPSVLQQRDGRRRPNHDGRRAWGIRNIIFWDSSTAANANISLSRGSVNTYFDSSTAANATYTLGYGSQLQFSSNSSASSATITAAGSSLYPYAGGKVTFNTTSLVNNATITLNGGTVSLGTGAVAAFINGAHAGNATITAHGGFNGGGGAQITFDAGAKAIFMDPHGLDTARTRPHTPHRGRAEGIAGRSPRGTPPRVAGPSTGRWGRR